jgi:4-hydroxy-2-oxoglutarate aldolase
LDTEAVVTLAGHPNVVGVIDAAGDLAPIQELLHSAPDGFQVLAGADSLLCEALEAGAAAVVPSLANPLPFFCLSIAEAVRTRELDSARELQQRAAAAAALTERYGIPGLKYAMDLKGYYGGGPRLPLLPLGEQARREITEALRELSS